MDKKQESSIAYQSLFKEIKKRTTSKERNKQISTESLKSSPTTNKSKIDSNKYFIAEINSILTPQNKTIIELLKNQENKVSKLEKSLLTSIKKETLNATKQLEAFFSINTYFETGKLIPGMHGWPISPDFALFMIEILEKETYDAVIEFGSGTSTVLIANVLKNKRKFQNTQQISFDHLDYYYKQTNTNLKQVETNNTQLILAPLKPYITDPTYSYYECENHIANLAKKMPKINSHIFVLVDGPPAATNKHARYPAVPIILKYFPNAKIDILLDDYARNEEKEIIKMWVKDIEKKGGLYTLTEKTFEKGACLLSIQLKQG